MLAKSLSNGVSGAGRPSPNPSYEEFCEKVLHTTLEEVIDNCEPWELFEMYDESLNEFDD